MTSRGRSGRDVRDLVAVELLGRRDELVAVHVRDERLAHGLRHFEQDLAVALGAHQIPHLQTLGERQRLEDVGDIGRMHLVELAFELDQVLLVHERLDQVVARHGLAVDDVLHDPLLARAG